MSRHEQDEHRYDNIIDMPHHVSATRPRMPSMDRAAQFAPFAALTGLGTVMSETARLTGRRIELDEHRKTELNHKLMAAAGPGEDLPEVRLTYFVPDDRKTGGAYAAVQGYIKRVDEYERVIVLRDGTRIPLDELIELETL